MDSTTSSSASSVTDCTVLGPQSSSVDETSGLSKGIFPSTTLPSLTSPRNFNLPALSTVPAAASNTLRIGYQQKLSSLLHQQHLYFVRLREIQAQNALKQFLPQVRKQYSQNDLDAALQDIQSGRIGTRRASVVYGIPRSTLRNKIYKLDGGKRSLGSVEESANGTISDTTNLPLPSTNFTTHTNSVLDSESTVPSTFDKEIKVATVASVGSDFTTVPLASALPTLTYSHSTTPDLPYSHSTTPNLPYSHSSSPTLLRPKANQPTIPCPKINLPTLPDPRATLPLLPKPMSTSTEAFSFNSQQLRLPTQQPQQLFGQFPLPQTPNTPLSPQQVNFNIIQALLLRQIYANSAALNKNGADGTSPVSTTSPVVLNEVVDVKPSRPKRGQYRRYDKSALEQAVQAVRSGEMSVHRAGSFFGVPHSTLEYKVKERAKKSSQSSFDDNKSPSFSNFSPSFKMPEARLKLPEGRFKMPEGYLKSPEGVVKVPEANLNMMSDIQLQEIHNNFRRILLTFAANQVRTMEESKEQ